MRPVLQVLWAVAAGVFALLLLTMWVTGSATVAAFAVGACIVVLLLTIATSRQNRWRP